MLYPLLGLQHLYVSTYLCMYKIARNKSIFKICISAIHIQNYKPAQSPSDTTIPIQESNDEQASFVANITKCADNAGVTPYNEISFAGIHGYELTNVLGLTLSYSAIADPALLCERNIVFDGQTGLCSAIMTSSVCLFLNYSCSYVNNFGLFQILMTLVRFFPTLYHQIYIVYSFDFSMIRFEVKMSGQDATLMNVSFSALVQILNYLEGCAPRF